MYELKVKNPKGEILNLTTSPNYIVYKIEGLTTPKATINESANATSDGAVITGARLESRNIVIYVSLRGDIETSRINLYKYFPAKKTVSLYFKNGTRNVVINGTVEVIECDLFAQSQTAQISIICPKPYFKDIEDFVVFFSTIDPYFEFPFGISKKGVEFSTISTYVRKSIINAGDIDTGVIIKLYATGTVVNPILYNVQDGTHLKLNITLQASDTIIINTNIGEKSITLIREGISSNAMGYMQADSSWFVLTGGDNVFTYDCESGTDFLQITFTTSILYSGV